MKKVRLKWVKNRSLDHIIDRDTHTKACCLLLEYIARHATSTSSPIPARHLSQFQKHLGLTIPVDRFLRRFPNLFVESPHPRYPSLNCFSLSNPASLLLSRLSSTAASSDSHLRLARLLMLSHSRSLPLSALFPLRYDLGLPLDFASRFPSLHPHLFTVSRGQHPEDVFMSLTSYPMDLAISCLQRRHSHSHSPSYGDLKKPPSSPEAPLAFPMRFPRGYGSMTKVKAWMDEFHRLPYISPYADPTGIDPDSDLMEKRVVGVLHELLSLTIHKKTKRNYIRNLREELMLPHRFTRIFTRYPGIFYYSLKCKTSTVVLREGYERGKLVEPHPMASLRDKVNYVMRTGVLYRDRGLKMLIFDDDNEHAQLNGDDAHSYDDDDDDDVENYELDISEGEEDEEDEGGDEEA